MAPPTPLLLYPPGDLLGPVPTLLNGVERLVASSGLHTGAARYKAQWGANYTSGSALPLNWFDIDR